MKWQNSEQDKLLSNSIKGKLKLLLNRKVAFDKSIIYNSTNIDAFLDINLPKLFPEDKINNLLEYIHSKTLYDGESILFKFGDSQMLSDLYFQNEEECIFYVATAENKELINRGKYSTTASYISLIVEGLTKIINNSEIKMSKQCFVAMSFDDDMNIIFNEAISPAIKQCGFAPYIVSNINIESDTTINDAILAGIKRAKFTIADFTGHKAGVYFEAGYALGRGQKVIYTCKDTDLGKTHFDTRNYQHIVWKDSNDLREKLINKIEAFIKD
ncbi:hypothetical protein IDJ75_20895 [Mucilaginibacter rigui]|uniref:Nucleoside 2-deoxyribosyltransferase n=1 Tax=Mucilaginibacter rigui TaxID=534635 RepID=A0ABR7XAY2_9SPHI|nr:hypothetical protein [Mucilaginibacter rigui]MBD1387753.1 hypothetical protein [Mucilaginibacter rigui]